MLTDRDILFNNLSASFTSGHTKLKKAVFMFDEVHQPYDDNEKRMIRRGATWGALGGMSKGAYLGTVAAAAHGAASSSGSITPAHLLVGGLLGAAAGGVGGGLLGRHVSKSGVEGIRRAKKAFAQDPHDYVWSTNINDHNLYEQIRQGVGSTPDEWATEFEKHGMMVGRKDIPKTLSELWWFDDLSPTEEKKPSTIQRVGRFAKKNWLPIAAGTAGVLAIGAGVAKGVIGRPSNNPKADAWNMARTADKMHSYLPTEKTKEYAQENYGKPDQSYQYYEGIRGRNIRNRNTVFYNAASPLGGSGGVDEHLNNYNRLGFRAQAIKEAIRHVSGGKDAKKGDIGMHAIRALIKNNKLQESLVRIIALADTMMQGTSAIMKELENN